jgi:hypothetical protein
LATLPTLATLVLAKRRSSMFQSPVGCAEVVMGKRSAFPRRAADFYPTPPAAVAPLIPYLAGIGRFAEPCGRRPRADPGEGRPPLHLRRRYPHRKRCPSVPGEFRKPELPEIPESFRPPPMSRFCYGRSAGEPASPPDVGLRLVSQREMARVSVQ